jgi:LAO/AO transport system kinase
LEKKGIDTIWEEINKYQRHTITTGFFQQKRTEQDHFWLHETLKELLINGLTSNQTVQAELPELEALVHEGKLSAFDAAEKLYAYYRSTIQ